MSNQRTEERRRIFAIGTDDHDHYSLHDYSHFQLCFRHSVRNMGEQSQCSQVLCRHCLLSRYRKKCTCVNGGDSAERSLNTVGFSADWPFNHYPYYKIDDPLRKFLFRKAPQYYRISAAIYSPPTGTSPLSRSRSSSPLLSD